MFILFHLNKKDIDYLYTNLFKFLNSELDKENFNTMIDEALSEKYSYVTYSKDQKDFIDFTL